MSDVLLTPVEAAERLRTSVPTLARWRGRGAGPRWVKLGGRVLYRESDLEAFIEALSQRWGAPLHGN